MLFASDDEAHGEPVELARSSRSLEVDVLLARECRCQRRTCTQQFAGQKAQVLAKRQEFTSLSADDKVPWPDMLELALHLVRCLPSESSSIANGDMMLRPALLLLMIVSLAPYWGLRTMNKTQAASIFSMLMFFTRQMMSHSLTTDLDPIRSADQVLCSS